MAQSSAVDEFNRKVQEYLRQMMLNSGQDPNAMKQPNQGGQKQQGGQEFDINQSVTNKIAKELLEKGYDYAFGSDLATTEAANAAWNAPAMEAANAAWNAGAMGATEAAAVDAAIGGMISGGIPAGMTALGAGAYAIPAGTAVPAGFTAVGSAIDGGLILASNSALGAGAAGAGTAGAATGATTGAATGAAAGSTASTLAAAAPWVAAVIAAYLTYKGRSDLKGSLGGSDLTDDEILKTYPGGEYISKIPGVDLMWKVNPMRQLEKSLWGTTKSTDQVYRDRMRKFMQKKGILGDDFTANLAQGGTFDFGKDGGARLTNSSGEGERRYNELDPSRKDISTAIALVNPLAYLASLNTGHKDKDAATAMAGYMTNAATQNSTNPEDWFKNASDWAAKMGINQQNYAATIDALDKQGILDQEGMGDVFKLNLGFIAPDAEGAQDTTQARLKAYLESVAREAQKNAPA